MLRRPVGCLHAEEPKAVRTFLQHRLRLQNRPGTADYRATFKSSVRVGSSPLPFLWHRKSVAAVHTPDRVVRVPSIYWFHLNEGAVNCDRRFVLTMVTASSAMIGLCSSAAAEEKADPTGVWSLRTIRPGRPAQESILKLRKNGDQLMGVITDGQGRNGSIKDAKLKGSDISFRVEIERDSQKLSFAYKGKLANDAIKGTVTATIFGRETNFDFDGKRVKENTTLSGSWELAMAFGGRPRGQGGTPRPPGDRGRPGETGGRGRQGGALTRRILLNLKEENGKINGDFVGFSGKPTPIQDVKLKDGELSFKVPQEMGPNKVTMNFVAKLAGDKMLGTAKILMPFGAREFGFQGNRSKSQTATRAAPGNYASLSRTGRRLSRL